MVFTPQKTYMYCVDQEIRIDKFTLPCPSHVFSLPRSAGFSIGNFTDNATAQVIDEKNVSLIDNMMIGSVIYPAAG